MNKKNYKIKKLINDPSVIIARIWVKISRFIKSDYHYLQIYFMLKMKTKFDKDAPITYQEKLQWLKLYNKNPLYTQMADKLGVRKIIKEKIGEQFLIPLLGSWESFDAINFDLLPSEFVLKTTHDSGTIVIVKDKNKFIESKALNKAKRKLSKAMKSNYFYQGREYQYKSINPRIIAEKFMQDPKQNDLIDYKFFCFWGIPKLVFIASDRYKGGVPKFDFYDMNFNKMPFIAKGHPQSDYMKKPPNFDEMTSIASKLSQGIPHVRIDLYNVNGNIYFGEFTFFHDGGFVPFVPKEWNKKLGDLIELPNERYSAKIKLKN